MGGGCERNVNGGWVVVSFVYLYVCGSSVGMSVSLSPVNEPGSLNNSHQLSFSSVSLSLIPLMSIPEHNNSHSPARRPNSCSQNHLCFPKTTTKSRSFKSYPRTIRPRSMVTGRSSAAAKEADAEADAAVVYEMDKQLIIRVMPGWPLVDSWLVVRFRSRGSVFC